MLNTNRSLAPLVVWSSFSYCVRLGLVRFFVCVRLRYLGRFFASATSPTSPEASIRVGGVARWHGFRLRSTRRRRRRRPRLDIWISLCGCLVPENCLCMLGQPQRRMADGLCFWGRHQNRCGRSARLSSVGAEGRWRRIDVPNQPPRGQRYYGLWVWSISVGSR